MSVTFEVVFMVRVDCEPDEVVCVVGDCHELGDWNPHHAKKLHRESSPRLQRKDYSRSNPASPTDTQRNDTDTTETKLSPSATQYK